MNTRNISLSLAALCFATLPLMAQLADKGETKVSLQYQFGLPMGGFKANAIENASPRGFTLDITHFLSNKVAIGAGFGWQDYHQKYPRSLYPQGDGSMVSAVISNSIQTMPVLARVQYYPTAHKEGAKVLPFISGGAGVNLVSFEQLFGSLGNVNDFSLHFAAQAGGGIRVPFGKAKTNSFLLTSHYSIMPYSKFGLNGLNQLQFGAGIQLRLKDDGGGSSNSDRWDRNNRPIRPGRGWGWW